MEKSTGWCVFHDWIDVLKKLEKDAAWDIIVAIDEYFLTGKDPIQAVKSIEQQVIITMMYQQIQRRENVSAKRKKAGQEGGIIKAQNSKSKQNVAKGSKSKQNVAKGSKAKQSVATITETITETMTETMTNTTLACGIYDNVTLSQSDLAKLKEEFPDDYEQRIDRLSEYMESTGKQYKNHFATIRAWAKREDAKQVRDSKERSGSFDVDDFFAAAVKKALGDN
jgi:hypothetical protein